MPGRSGRGWGELRGDLIEVRALAQWMREQVDLAGMTVAQVAARVSFGHDKISRALNGAARPDFIVLKEILEAVVAPAYLRVRLVEARTLWNQADPDRAHPVPAGSAAVARTEPAGQALIARERELSDQLFRALSNSAELQKSLGQSHTIILTLSALVGRLRGQVDSLTRTRDQLLQERPADPGSRGVEQRLKQAEEQHRRVKESLEQANRERDEARALHEVAEAKIAALTEQLAAVRDTQADEPATAVPPEQAASSAGTAGEDVDQVLERAGQLLEAQAAHRAEIADELIDPGDSGRRDTAERIVPGQIIGQSRLSDAAARPDPSRPSDKPDSPAGGPGRKDVALEPANPRVRRPAPGSSPYPAEASVVKSAISQVKKSGPNDTRHRGHVKTLANLVISEWTRSQVGTRVAVTDGMLRLCLEQLSLPDLVLLLGFLPNRPERLADTLAHFFAQTATPEAILQVCRHTSADAPWRPRMFHTIANERPELLEQLTDLDLPSFQALMLARENATGRTTAPRQTKDQPAPQQGGSGAAPWRGYGTVKFFSAEKGFGLIANDDGTDVFVHRTSLVIDGHKNLEQGQRVSFDRVLGDKIPEAKNVRPVDPSPAPRRW